MKKVFSLLMALVLVMSLVSVMGVSALAEEETEGGVTVLVTGGMGAAAEDGLRYATLAAWKNTYEEDAVLLVDAGDFDVAAVPVMNAAGYDLAVPDQAVEDADFACVSMGVEDLKAGAYLEKNETAIAVIGLCPMGDETAEDYYAAIQNNVDAATGADFIIAVGQTEDGQALVENVTGLSAVVILGDETDESVVSTGEETSALVATVAADGVAVLKLSADGVEGSHAAVEDITALELTDDETVAEAEEAWLAALAQEEADAEETDAEETDAEEAEEPADGEDAEEAETDDQTAQDTEETEEEPADEQNDSAEDQQDTESTQEEEQVSGSDAVIQQPDPTPAQESAVSTSDAVLDTDQSSEQPNDEDPADDPTDDEDNDDQDDEESEAPAQTTLETITFDRGTSDLVVELTGAALSKIQIGDEDSTYFLVEGNDYSVSNGGLTVTLFANTLNNWPAAGSTQSATYKFRFIQTDGNVVEKKILIQGSYTAPLATETPAPTATAEPTATAAPTATPTSTKGTNPATGDNSPILLYVVILVVLVAALVVVVVLATKKKKK
jgi:hypothetical protein